MKIVSSIFFDNITTYNRKGHPNQMNRNYAEYNSFINF